MVFDSSGMGRRQAPPHLGRDHLAGAGQEQDMKGGVRDGYMRSPRADLPALCPSGMARFA